MKKTLHRGGFDTLNVYTNLAGGLPRLRVPPRPAGLAPLAGRDRAQLGVDAGRVADVRGPLRPRLHARARGRPLVQPRAHVLRRLQRQGRLRRRHAADARADVAAAPRARTPAASRGSTRSTTTWTTRTTLVTTSSRRVRSAGCRTAGSSSGLRKRPLERGGREAALQGFARPGICFCRCPVMRGRIASAVPATLVSPRARSSGDRAFASGAKGRTFESCRAHALPSRADP